MKFSRNNSKEGIQLYLRTHNDFLRPVKFPVPSWSPSFKIPRVWKADSSCNWDVPLEGACGEFMPSFYVLKAHYCEQSELQKNEVKVVQTQGSSRVTRWWHIFHFSVAQVEPTLPFSSPSCPICTKKIVLFTKNMVYTRENKKIVISQDGEGKKMRGCARGGAIETIGSGSYAYSK
jgi:hypothetical protein